MKHSVLMQLQRDSNRMEICTGEMSGIGESKWFQIVYCHDGDLRSSSIFLAKRTSPLSMKISRKSSLVPMGMSFSNVANELPIQI